MAAIGFPSNVRTALPIVRQADVRLTEAEHGRLARLAERILRNEPTLTTFEVFGRRVAPGLDDGPALLFENHTEIALFSRHDDAALQYRSLLLAGDGDLVLIGGRRHLAFERYCCGTLGLGAAKVISVPPDAGPGSPPLPTRSTRDAEAFGAILNTARGHGRLNLIPYLGTGSVWKLAADITAATGARIRVAAPPPRLTQSVNDKLWFVRRVTEVLGKQAQPPSFHVFGPAALAARIAALARRFERVVVKIPESAGSAGNLVLQSAAVRALPLSVLRRQILGLVHGLGWRTAFPLLVGVWDCAVLCSPSVQIWVPIFEYGLPVVEGLFDQVVRGDECEFIGAKPCALPEPLRRRLATEAFQLACLFQRLGYFGRCSFDAIVTGTDFASAALRWVECNGRWGGTSIPMTLANRLLGDWTQRQLMIVQRSGLQIPGCHFQTALNRLGPLGYRRDGDGTGVVVLTAGGLEEGCTLHFLLLGHSTSDVQRQILQLESLFMGNPTRSPTMAEPCQEHKP